MKLTILAVLILMTLPISAFAEGGLTAKGLVKILSTKSVTNVLKTRAIDKIEVEPLSAMESGGFIIRIIASEAGLSPAGPSTHPCFITVQAIRGKYDLKAPFTVTAREVCAASAPRPVR